MILFIPSISYKFKNITKEFDVNLSYFSLNKLEYIIKGHKDTLPNLSQKNVVYNCQSCKDCNATYVGQTGRKLKIRINKHRNHVRKNTNTESVITEHRIKFNHEFDWDKIIILDKRRFLNEQLISEMLHIKRQDNSLILQTDTKYLHYAYVSIMSKL